MHQYSLEVARLRFVSSIESLETQLQTATTEAARLQSENAALNETIATLRHTEEANHLELQRIESLETQLQTATAEAARLQSENAALNETIATLRHTQGANQRQLQRLQAAQEQASQAREEASRAKGSCAALEALVAKLRAETSNHETEHQDRVTTLSTRLDEALQTVSTLQQEQDRLATETQRAMERAEKAEGRANKLQKEASQLQEQAARIQEDYEIAGIQLAERASAQLAAKTQELDDLVQKLSRAEAKASGEVARSTQLSTQLTDIQRQLHAARHDEALAQSQIRTLQDNIQTNESTYRSSLQTAEERLQTALGDLNELRNDHQRVLQANEQLQLTESTLQQQLQESTWRHQAEFKSARDAHKRELELVRARLVETEQELDELRQQADTRSSQLHRRLAEKEQEVQSVTSRLARLQIEVDQLKSSTINDLQSQLERQTQAVAAAKAAAERERQLLRDQLESVSTQRDSAQQSSAALELQVAADAEEIRGLRSSNETLQTRVEELVDAAAQHETALATAETRNATLCKRLEQLDDRLVEEKGILTKTTELLDGARADFSEITARNHALETQLQGQRQATAESESRLVAAEARVATLHSQLNRQQEQHHDELQESLKAQQTGLEELVQQLTSKLASLEGVEAECRRLKDGNEAYHRQVTRLEEALASATKTVADSEARHESKLLQHKQQLSDTTRQLDDAKQQVDRLQVELAAAESAQERLRAKERQAASATTEQFQHLHQRSQLLEQTIAELRLQLREAQAAHSDETDAASELRATLSAMTTSHAKAQQALKAKVATLKGRLDDSERERLQQTLTDQARVSSLQEAVQAHQTQLRHLREEQEASRLLSDLSDTQPPPEESPDGTRAVLRGQLAQERRSRRQAEQELLALRQQLTDARATAGRWEERAQQVEKTLSIRDAVEQDRRQRERFIVAELEAKDNEIDQLRTTLDSTMHEALDQSQLSSSTSSARSASFARATAARRPRLSASLTMGSPLRHAFVETSTPHRPSRATPPPLSPSPS